MTNVRPFPSGGGGPGDSALDQRVAKVEADLQIVKDSLARLEAAVTSLTKDSAEIRTKLAFIEGRIQGMPTTWQLLTIVLTTWALGTGLLFAVLRFAEP